MFAFTVENLRRKWFISEKHTKIRKKNSKQDSYVLLALFLPKLKMPEKEEKMIGKGEQDED